MLYSGKVSLFSDGLFNNDVSSSDYRASKDMIRKQPTEQDIEGMIAAQF
jgi:hypothetical protein